MSSNNNNNDIDDEIVAAVVNSRVTRKGRQRALDKMTGQTSEQQPQLQNNGGSGNHATEAIGTRGEGFTSQQDGDNGDMEADQPLSPGAVAHSTVATHFSVVRFSMFLHGARSRMEDARNAPRPENNHNDEGLTSLSDPQQHEWIDANVVAVSSAAANSGGGGAYGTETPVNANGSVGSDGFHHTRDGNGSLSQRHRSLVPSEQPGDGNSTENDNDKQQMGLWSCFSQNTEKGQIHLVVLVVLLLCILTGMIFAAAFGALSSSTDPNINGGNNGNNGSSSNNVPTFPTSAPSLKTVAPTLAPWIRTGVFQGAQTGSRIGQSTAFGVNSTTLAYTTKGSNGGVMIVNLDQEDGHEEPTAQDGPIGPKDSDIIRFSPNGTILAVTGTSSLSLYRFNETAWVPLGPQIENLSNSTWNNRGPLRIVGMSLAFVPPDDSNYGAPIVSLAIQTVELDEYSVMVLRQNNTGWTMRSVPIPVTSNNDKNLHGQLDNIDVFLSDDGRVMSIARYASEAFLDSSQGGSFMTVYRYVEGGTSVFNPDSGLMETMDDMGEYIPTTDTFFTSSELMVADMVTVPDEDIVWLALWERRIVRSFDLNPKTGKVYRSTGLSVPVRETWNPAAYDMVVSRDGSALVFGWIRQSLGIGALSVRDPVTGKLRPETILEVDFETTEDMNNNKMALSISPNGDKVAMSFPDLDDSSFVTDTGRITILENPI